MKDRPSLPVGRVEHHYVARAAEPHRGIGLLVGRQATPGEPLRRGDDHEVSPLDGRLHAPALDGDERGPRAHSHRDDERDEQDRRGGREQFGGVPSHVAESGWKRLEPVGGRPHTAVETGSMARP